MDARSLLAAALPLTVMLLLPCGRPQAHGQDSLESRLWRLEQANAYLMQQNAYLMQQLRAAPQPMPVAHQPPPALPPAAPPAPPDQEWMEVGKNLDMTAVWRHGLWVETKDKSFQVHVGGRVQHDVVWLHGNDAVQFAPGGMGPLQDGTNFRRARFAVEGRFYEVVEFNTEFDFVNTFDFESTNPAVQADVANTPVPTDLWVQLTQLPVIGTFRVGNMKPPISFEHLTSSRYLHFLERSLAFDAFIGGLDNGFRPGFMFFNGTDDQQLTWALGAFKSNTTVFGWNTGDGEWDLTGRLTYLLYYADDGRHMIHLGLGASYRDLDEGRVRLRSRTLLRNGPGPLHPALVNVLLAGDDQTILVPEFAMNWGPWTVQAEYYGVWVTDTVFPAAGGTQQGTTFFESAYIEVLYFLTGEHRPYSKIGGSGAAFARVVPRSYFFCVRDENGNLCAGPGAWQVGVRYSWIDLNDRGIPGGVAQDVTFGLNWYLNPNLKFQWNYTIADRDLNGPSDGVVHGFGMRTAFDF
jgi:phosphate-selective porin OprO/OprP